MPSKHKKSLLVKIKDNVLGLIFALLIAILVRQTVFELYEIPTGSMRPTFKEQDRLIVSKTSFGLNFPLTPKHFYFNNSLVDRAQTIVFTGEGMDIPDVDTMYFYIFPGKKLYVKRLMGKPGDTLYFQEGKIYGIDAEGNDISSALNPEILGSIDHIPFINFEGNVKTPTRTAQTILSPAILHQMNQPIAKLSYVFPQKVEGEMLIPDVKEYSDLWGIGNFAMLRLLSCEEIKNYTKEPLPEALLYLEIKHHPSIQTAFLGYDMQGRFRPMLGTEKSFFPIQENHARALFQGLYTARFVVKNGIAYRYSIEQAPPPASFCPKLDNVPDGCYEFYDGIAYQIDFGGITKVLPKEHPLYTFTTERLQTLFNLGIEWDLRFMPNPKRNDLFPSRYGYFREGALYAMGAPIASAEDPSLRAFIEQEKKTNRPFIPKPIPTKEEIKQYGLKIPEKMYLALGDNHAMSGDSRCFGFVPEGNLRGTPVYLFWPPGNRFGLPNQPFTAPSPTTILMWSILFVLIGIWYYRKHRKT